MAPTYPWRRRRKGFAATELVAIHHNGSRLPMNDGRIGEAGAGLVSQHTINPWRQHKQYTVRAGVWTMRRRRKEKEKSELSSSSFGSATMVFGLTEIQQPTHQSAAIQTIFLFGLTFGKGERKISLLLLILCKGRYRLGRSRIGAAI